MSRVFNLNNNKLIVLFKIAPFKVPPVHCTTLAIILVCKKYIEINYRRIYKIRESESQQTKVCFKVNYMEKSILLLGSTWNMPINNTSLTYYTTNWFIFYIWIFTKEIGYWTDKSSCKEVKTSSLFQLPYLSKPTPLRNYWFRLTFFIYKG